MKQFNKKVLCYYCLGCNKCELEEFEGIMNCKNFVEGKNIIEFYKKMREDNKNGLQA